MTGDQVLEDGESSWNEVVVVIEAELVGSMRGSGMAQHGASSLSTSTVSAGDLARKRCTGTASAGAGRCQYPQ